MKNIYLIGFMGSGKSTVGKHLANELNKSFIDLDDYIENKHKIKIQDIFKDLGEEGFRSYEKIALKEVQNYDIVATGGGIVEKEENISVMREGRVIFLKTSFEEIEKRLKDDKNRPLWNQEREQQLELFNRREKIYASCSHKTIKTDKKSILEIVEEIKLYVMNN